MGIHLQFDSRLQVVGTEPPDPVRSQVFVSSDTDFAGNATLLGTGPMVLPEPGGGLAGRK